MEKQRRDKSIYETSTYCVRSGEEFSCEKTTGTIQNKSSIIVNVDGLYDFSWKTVVLDNRSENDIISFVSVFAAAIEALALRPNIQAFVYSCNVIVRDEFIGASDSLIMQRHPNGFLFKNVI